MNKTRTEKRKSSALAKALLFLLVLLLLVGTLLLRYLRTPSPQNVVSPPEITPAAENTPIHQPEEESVPAPAQELDETASGGEDTDTLTQDPEIPAVTVNRIPDENGTAGKVKQYTAETYQLVTDLVYAYRHLGASGWPQVEETLEKLKAVDPPLGELWDGIMRKWAYVSEELTVTPDVLPDGLPQDDSLCIAVMGYQLLPDGSMAAELQKRCEIGLSLAEKYPNAFLAVTGGGTAPLNKEVTEAETMAEWFLKQGIAADRLIVENRSLTTGQNAKNTCAILTDQYPQVKEIAVVSSSYHIPQCELLFTEAALLYACNNDCEVPYTVTGNAAFAAVGNDEYSDTSNLGADIWVMADPNY